MRAVKIGPRPASGGGTRRHRRGAGGLPRPSAMARHVLHPPPGMRRSSRYVIVVRRGETRIYRQLQDTIGGVIWDRRTRDRRVRAPGDDAYPDRRAGERRARPDGALETRGYFVARVVNWLVATQFRWLIVVDRDRPELYAFMRHQFEGRAQVIPDRHAGEPDPAGWPAEAERRVGERREPLSSTDETLWRESGYRLIYQADGFRLYEAEQILEAVRRAEEVPASTTG